MPVGTIVKLVMLSMVSACTNTVAATRDDRTTGVTITGPPLAMQQFLDTPAMTRGDWTIERRWTTGTASTSVRLGLSKRPSFGDVGTIVALAQAARENRLTISDTDIVQTNAP